MSKSIKMWLSDLYLHLYKDAPHLVQVIDKAFAVRDHARILQCLKFKPKPDFLFAWLL